MNNKVFLTSSKRKNIFNKLEDNNASFQGDEIIRKGKIETIQINIGNRCNQTCSHCHIGASPQGKNNMDNYTAKKVLGKLLTLDIKDIEFTGGTPELNPNFKFFIEELSRRGKNIAVRTSLTVLYIPKYSSFIDLYKEHNVKVIASLPSVFEDDTDRQRGKGVFEKSIKVLKKLNEVGYGTEELLLDLVYNSAGDYLPPDQTQLEKEYKQLLEEIYDIRFNNLITIVNSPVKRFKNYIIKQGRLEDYMNLLREKFNIHTLENLMCRRLISVDYQGYVYDCDFNLALGIPIKGFKGKRIWEIDFEDFNAEITFDQHCYACSVNKGSSCHGVLIKDEEVPDVRGKVKQYYGEELKSSSDLKTSACCTLDSTPENIKAILPYIDDEIKMKFYGCGSPIPLAIEGLTVLDIGCGTGRDSYIFSKLIGENGFVYGLDMTENQIAVAKRHINEQTKRFGYKKPNVKFILDYIEHLENHFLEESIDIAVSNCVINLVENKEDVLRQIYNALKFGGEFFFSDIYADRRIPERLKKNSLLYNECLGGALYYRDFERVARKIGFVDPRIVSKRAINVTNDEVKSLIGNIAFYSITYRLCKITGLEDACEDYGHIAIYKGGIAESPFKFELDGSHVFAKNKAVRVCSNTALMLLSTRFKKYFQVIGSFDEHFGSYKSSGNEETKDDVDSEKNVQSCC